MLAEYARWAAMSTTSSTPRTTSRVVHEISNGGKIGPPGRQCPKHA